ncbi:MAG: HAMP domain-containing protein [Nitrospinae bacterium]|nr:HAMP domain-containing protein [Nitrospinota bacterium]
MSLKIRWKLALSYILLASTVIAIVALFLHNFLHSRLVQYAEENLRKDIYSARDYISAEGAEKFPEELDRLADNLGELFNLRVSIIRADGVVFGDSMVPKEKISEVANHGDRPEFRQALSAGFGQNIRRSATVHSELLYMALPLDLKDKGLWVVRLALPLANIENASGELRRSLLKAGLLGVFISLVFGYATSLVITRRTLKIKEAAEAFARGDLQTKLPCMGRDELGDLSQSLNEMARKLNGYMEKLDSEKAEVKAVLSSMAEGVLILGQDLRIASINPALSNMLKSPVPAEGLTLMEAFRNTLLSDSAEKSLHELANVAVEVKPVPHMDQVCMVHFSPILFNNKAIGVVAVFNDITELRRLLSARKEFVANVSHELKTPLTAIRGFAETLAAGTLKDEQTRKKYIDGICRNAERLRVLIEDILYLSRIESKRVDITQESLDLHNELNEAISIVQEEAAKRNVVILNQIDKDCAQVAADRKQLGIVFLNLLDNAVKYIGNGKGTVKVAAGLPDTDELEKAGIPSTRREDFLRVAVEDNGSGIPEKDLPRIFERFYRVDKGRSRELGGTGLGLSIIKHIIENHGGKVWARSESGKGSSFFFLLPIAGSKTNNG